MRYRSGFDIIVEAVVELESNKAYFRIAQSSPQGRRDYYDDVSFYLSIARPLRGEHTTAGGGGSTLLGSLHPDCSATSGMRGSAGCRSDSVTSGRCAATAWNPILFQELAESVRDDGGRRSEEWEQSQG